MSGGGGRRFLVTATPPTTNGDLHVGHLSGPYLAADVFCRAQRLLGNTALYVSGGDDHQTYVVTTAERLGVDPVRLAADCNELIRETLEVADIAIDAFPSPNPEYVDFVQGFFGALYESGKLVRRTYRFPYSKGTGRFLVEAFAKGYCPECYAGTAGAICETCGHPNDVHSLLMGAATGDDAGDEVELREVETLVLPLEDYRDRFLDFYRRQGSLMRPHVLRFVEEMLSRPLPPFPVTYPAEWGIPVPFAGFDGQVLNVWGEMLPGLIHMTAAARRGAGDGTGADPWAPGSGYELVQFLGFDNTFYFSLAHLGLIFADGSVTEPSAIVTNEFFHLDGSKFSTSRRHLIWARDLIARHGVDNARFYLAFNNPELQVANFTELDLEAVLREKLQRPLAEIATALHPHEGLGVEVGAAADAIFARFRERMLRAYALETFSVRGAAEAVGHLLAFLAGVGGRVGDQNRDPELAILLAGLAHLATYVEPLLPSLSATLRERLGEGFALPFGAGLAAAELTVPALDPATLLDRADPAKPMPDPAAA